MPGLEHPSGHEALGAAATVDFFCGHWSYLRRIEDRRQGVVGSLIGEAHFLPEDEGLRYRETGELVLGDYRGAAQRGFIYRFPRGGWVEILFEDGRPLLVLDLSAGRGEAEHLCAEDLYRARVIVEGSHHWRADWTVTGPRKDYRLSTWYLRFGGCV